MLHNHFPKLYLQQLQLLYFSNASNDTYVCFQVIPLKDSQRETNYSWDRICCFVFLGFLTILLKISKSLISLRNKPTAIVPWSFTLQHYSCKLKECSHGIKKNIINQLLYFEDDLVVFIDYSDYTPL